MRAELQQSAWPSLKPKVQRRSASTRSQSWSRKPRMLRRRCVVIDDCQPVICPSHRAWPPARKQCRRTGARRSAPIDSGTEDDRTGTESRRAKIAMKAAAAMAHSQRVFQRARADAVSREQHDGGHSRLDAVEDAGYHRQVAERHVDPRQHDQDQQRRQHEQRRQRRCRPRSAVHQPANVGRELLRLRARAAACSSSARAETAARRSSAAAPPAR